MKSASFRQKFRTALTLIIGEAVPKEEPSVRAVSKAAKSTGEEARP